MIFASVWTQVHHVIVRGHVAENEALAHLNGREDLRKYGSNALMLFALELYLGTEDIHSVASEALTDGHGDRKCDLVFVDRKRRVAIVAQGYQTRKPNPAAPSNKAADLNIAIAFLLAGQKGEAPKALQSAAEELDYAIKQNEIDEILLWYVHNLGPSRAVQDELRTAARTTTALLRDYYPNSRVGNVEGVEVDASKIQNWYRATTMSVDIADDFTLKVSGGFKEAGDGWEAYCTSVPAAWLREQYEKYGDGLFSANVRGYLGSRRSDKNINHNIKSSALEDPGRFWAYNNGLTILVNDFSVKSGKRGPSATIWLSGISIVNGAQTTGSLGSAEIGDGEGLDEARVMARFVKCSNRETVSKIIKYNNSQNKVETADFRSNDEVQKRLRDEFDKIPGVTYLGGRRGGADDAIRRTRGLIPSDTAAQALAAFHSDPVLAYNQKSKIWEQNEVYARYFNDGTTACHIVFTYALLRCIQNRKIRLERSDESGWTEGGRSELDFLRKRGSGFLLMSALSAAMETVCDTPIPSKFALSFGAVDPSDAENIWAPLVDALIPFSDHLDVAFSSGGLRNRERLDDARAKFGSMVRSTRPYHSQTFRGFSEKLS